MATKAPQARAEPDPRPVDLLIEGGIVVTMDPDWRVLEDGAVAIDQGCIVAVGPRPDVVRDHRPRDLIDGRGRLVMPGLINAHTHAPMTLFRGLADDLPVEEWLQHYIWPAESRFMNPETIRWGTLLAVAEMIRSGVTTFCDMYFHVEHLARAAREAGMRALPSLGFVNFPLPGQSGPREALELAEEYIRRWQDDPLIIPSVAPHATYTVEARWIQEAKALADRYGVLMHIHVSETEGEVREWQERTGKTPVKYLDDLGVLGRNVLAVHCVWVTPDEIELMAERDVAVAHCPESNMKLGSGTAPLLEMLQAGLRVGLGTDGAGSNNDLSILGEIQTAALLDKLTHRDPAAIKAPTVVRMGTLGGAEALGIDHLVGSLEVGKRADVILLDLSQPHLVPLYDVYSQIAYAARASDVCTTIIDGKVVMRDGELLTLDETEVMARVREIAGRIRAETTSMVPTGGPGGGR
jgi:5-methylthioadenosine/S-adenosylhomocysteine deaminase